VVASTSAGVSGALGWADGEHTPPDEMFDAIARIARVLNVPVTADIESGYSLPPEDIVRRLLPAGAVGCNLAYTDPRTAGTVRASNAPDTRSPAFQRASSDAVNRARFMALLPYVGE